MTNCNFLDGEIPYSSLRYLGSPTELGSHPNHFRLGHAEGLASVGLSGINILNFTWQR